VRGSVTARRLVLSAGSIGSTELLLRCRDQHRTLPRLPEALGKRWSSNGDFLTPAFYDESGRLISPTHGPTITCAIDYLDGEKYGQSRYVIEDGGFPPLFRVYLEERLGPKAVKARTARGKLLLAELRRYIDSDDEAEHVMPWFANGVDAADGRLYLGRDWLPPWRLKLKMDWQIAKSKRLIDTIVKRQVQLSKKTGGRAWVSPMWKYFHDLITPHPLGGCNMDVPASNAPGDVARPGVVDHRGKVLVRLRRRDPAGGDRHQPVTHDRRGDGAKRRPAARGDEEGLARRSIQRQRPPQRSVDLEHPAEGQPARATAEVALAERHEVVTEDVAGLRQPRLARFQGHVRGQSALASSGRDARDDRASQPFVDRLPGDDQHRLVADARKLGVVDAAPGRPQRACQRSDATRRVASAQARSSSSASAAASA
jgi:hypothetical protein